MRKRIRQLASILSFSPSPTLKIRNALLAFHILYDEFGAMPSQSVIKQQYSRIWLVYVINTQQDEAEGTVLAQLLPVYIILCIVSLGRDGGWSTKPFSTHEVPCHLSNASIWCWTVGTDGEGLPHSSLLQPDTVTEATDVLSTLLQASSSCTEFQHSCQAPLSGVGQDIMPAMTLIGLFQHIQLHTLNLVFLSRWELNLWVGGKFYDSWHHSNAGARAL